MAKPRDLFLIFATGALLVVGLMGSISSLAWVRAPFPGFLVLANGVIASAGLNTWPALRDGDLYQREIIAVDGVPVHNGREVRGRLQSLQIGTHVSFQFRDGDRTFERVIALRQFSSLDYVLLFGSYLVCGLGLGGVGLAIRYLRGGDPVATGSSLALWLIGMFALTATDLYGPYRLFRLHAALECFLFAGVLHLALVFPYPRRSDKLRRLILMPMYGLAAALAIVSQVGLYHPSVYSFTHRIAIASFGAALVGLIASQIMAFVRPPNFQARQRVKVLAIGTVAALLPQVALALLSALGSAAAPESAMGWSGLIFPLAIGFAVLRSDLLEVDSILRRTVNYVFLSIFLAVAYAGAFAAIGAVLGDAAPAMGGRSLIVFAALSFLIFLPLRDRLQAGIDLLFFRSTYDFRRLVEMTSERVASFTDLPVIAEEVSKAVVEALHPEWLVLVLVGGHPTAPKSVVVVGPTPPNLDIQAVTRHPDARPFDFAGGSLAIPFRVEDRLVATLLLGRRLSGRIYGGEDRRLLHTLANHGAVAFENALALEQLRELNRGLEVKVAERTAELREAQAQLVHREKMASLGQLVAGVAHEMNNPLNFLQGNLHILRQFTETLVRSLEQSSAVISAQAPTCIPSLNQIRQDNEVDLVLQDLEGTLSACEEAVGRTTKIVSGLNTFSRRGRVQASRVDLQEILERTLAVLRGKLRGIEVVREFGNPPAVECLADELAQVFMNLLSNAADAVKEGGRITIRTHAVSDSVVCVEIEDDGCGIDPAIIEKIFEPFFTTKEVGHGTGLGLAITYGVVTRHRGTLGVSSVPERGSRFSVSLPIKFQGEDAPQGSSGNQSINS